MTVSVHEEKTPLSRLLQRIAAGRRRHHHAVGAGGRAARSHREHPTCVRRRRGGVSSFRTTSTNLSTRTCYAHSKAATDRPAGRRCRSSSTRAPVTSRSGVSARESVERRVHRENRRWHTLRDGGAFRASFRRGTAPLTRQWTPATMKSIGLGVVPGRRLAPGFPGAFRF